MEEGEALRNYCTRMISHVLQKQHLDSSLKGERGKRRKEPREARGSRQTTSRGGHAGLQLWDKSGDHRECNLSPTQRAGALTSPGLTSQGPAAQLVPLRLISLLKHKTFKEEMRRALEVELHDPTVCSVCEQRQASVALNTFIRRKKTQLDVRALEDRPNKNLRFRIQCLQDWKKRLFCLSLLGEFVHSPSKPFNAPHRIWEELLGRDMRVTATWSCLSNKSGTLGCPGNR